VWYTISHSLQARKCVSLRKFFRQTRAEMISPAGIFSSGYFQRLDWFALGLFANSRISTISSCAACATFQDGSSWSILEGVCEPRSTPSSVKIGLLLDACHAFRISGVYDPGSWVTENLDIKRAVTFFYNHRRWSENGDLRILTSSCSNYEWNLWYVYNVTHPLQAARSLTNMLTQWTVYSKTTSIRN
jgi:hypothetical protein